MAKVEFKEQIEKEKIIMYSRTGCGLCVEAFELLKEELPNKYEIEVRDIAKSDEETQKYGLMIPVLEYHGRIVAYGNIHKNDILELIK